MRPGKPYPRAAMESPVSTAPSSDQVSRMDSSRAPSAARVRGLPPASSPTPRRARRISPSRRRNRGTKRRIMDSSRDRVGAPRPSRHIHRSAVITRLRQAHHPTAASSISAAPRPKRTDSRVSGLPPGK